MNLLAIETSTDACSVALRIGDESLVDHRVEPRRHAQLVLPMIDALLAEAGLARGALDGVAFGRGPGSFTGVRIAASVTQGIALGLDIGVVGVSTLRTIAQGCLREFGDTRVGVALDARLEEVYWGAFRCRAGEGSMSGVGDERVVLPGGVTLDATGEAPSDGSGDGSGGAAPITAAERVGAAGWRLAGAGAERYAKTLAETLGIAAGQVREGRLPNARDTLALALVDIAGSGLGPPESAVPVYLRERVALTEAERASAAR